MKFLRFRFMGNDVSGISPLLFRKDDFKVDEKDPWKNDKLDRKKHAMFLTSLIEEIRQPFVITLTAPYGMGKTTFLDCWKHDLKTQNKAVVSFNAWENDFGEDPFVAFFASVSDQLEFDKSEPTKRIKKAGLRLASSLLKNSPKLAVKAITKKVIGEDIEDLLKIIEVDEDDVVEISESLVGDLFEEQKKSVKSVKQFRNALQEFIEKHLNGRLVVLIDDLDRCRPNYAVQVLERIKHLFALKGIVFIIAMDKKQLSNSVKGVYGNGIDADEYLKKFIDWEFALPEPDILKYSNFLYEDVFRFQDLNIFYDSDEARSGRISFLRYSTLLMLGFGNSLRTVDRYYTYMYQLFRSIQPGTMPVMVCLAALIKHNYKDDFQDFIQWKGTLEFQDTPIQDCLQSIVTKFEVAELKRTSTNRRWIANLILYFSYFDNEKNEARICVSREFIEKTFEGQKRLNAHWFKERLENFYHPNKSLVEFGLEHLEVMTNP